MAETRSASKLLTILSAAGATGAGSAASVAPYQHMLVSVRSDNSADLTVQCQGSLADEAPDWASAAAVDNDWDYIGMQLLDDGTLVAGDTGVVFSGTDAVHYYMINTDALKWVNFRVTAHVAGDVTIQICGFNNA